MQFRTEPPGQRAGFPLAGGFASVTVLNNAREVCKRTEYVGVWLGLVPQFIQFPARIFIECTHI